MKLLFKKSTTAWCATLFLGLLITSCVSSLLKEKIPDFSDEINVKAPASPFKQIRSGAYPSWKNNDTQNVIMMMSNCDNSKYPVSHAYLTISENMENPKIENSKVDNLKLPKYVAKQLHGTVDDTDVEVQTVAFAYRECVYLSALSGKPTSIGKDFENWKSFLNAIELKK